MEIKFARAEIIRGRTASPEVDLRRLWHEDSRLWLWGDKSYRLISIFAAGGQKPTGTDDQEQAIITSFPANCGGLFIVDLCCNGIVHAYSI